MYVISAERCHCVVYFELDPWCSSNSTTKCIDSWLRQASLADDDDGDEARQDAFSLSAQFVHNDLFEFYSHVFTPKPLLVKPWKCIYNVHGTCVVLLPMLRLWLGGFSSDNSLHYCCRFELLSLFLTSMNPGFISIPLSFMDWLCLLQNAAQLNLTKRVECIDSPLIQFRTSSDQQKQ